MSGFEIKLRNDSDVHVLEIKGELDAHTAPTLEDEITALIDQGNHQIVVNFAGLNYISSAGLGVFMAYIEVVRDLGGDIKFSNMQPNIYNVCDLLGFPTLYDIVDEELEAIQKFNNQ